MVVIRQRALIVALAVREVASQRCEGMIEARYQSARFLQIITGPLETGN